MAGCIILANMFLAGVGTEVISTIHLGFFKTHIEEVCPNDYHGSFGRPGMV